MAKDCPLAFRTPDVILQTGQTAFKKALPGSLRGQSYKHFTVVTYGRNKILRFQELVVFQL